MAIMTMKTLLCSTEKLVTTVFVVLFTLVGCVVVNGYQQDKNSLVSVLHNRRVWPEPAIFKRGSVANSSILLIDPCDFHIMNYLGINFFKKKKRDYNIQYDRIKG